MIHTLSFHQRCLSLTQESNQVGEHTIRYDSFRILAGGTNTQSPDQVSPESFRGAPRAKLDVSAPTCPAKLDVFVGN